jgi:hypothetical protein
MVLKGRKLGIRQSEKKWEFMDVKGRDDMIVVI